MKKNKFVIYPVFIFLYPVLLLWAGNVRDVLPSQVYPALIAVISMGALLLLVVWLICRQWDQSALAASMTFLIFFSYGHLYNYLQDWNESLARHRMLLPVYGCLILAWGWEVFVSKRRIELWSSIFGVVGPVLFLFPLYTLAGSMLMNASREEMSPPQVATVEATVPRPDIYYIVFDAYGRGDVLFKDYQYDNSAFLDYLEGAGFYVADRSTSNYVSTVLSLSSSLNMQYVKTLVPGVNPLTSDQVQLGRYEEDLLDFIRHSEVRRFLAENGYRLVTYDNQFKTTIYDADVLLSYSPLTPRTGRQEGGVEFALNGFDGMLLETSAARLWLDWQAAHGGKNILIEGPYLTHRNLTVDMFESLKEIPAMDGDNFVFMHFLVPHPPFVFGRNGETVMHNEPFSLADGVNYSGTRGSYIRGYGGQLEVTNAYLRESISYIIENSNPKPVIIIQGDHGPRMSLNFKNPKKTDLEAPFGNLNAYYLPGLDHRVLYPEITPVNSFRVVFNVYFGADMGLLPDENYLSTSIQPFDFTNVTQLVR